ncbi:hypothetical protein PT974_06901 [Cladobotryum mycophilum]|uniref:Uncharacterized protein n=1 Tax=Cladobotryum mycophilum TaxID=491253 RepID=A0ABR0SNY5_9HYPO
MESRPFLDSSMSTTNEMVVENRQSWPLSRLIKKQPKASTTELPQSASWRRPDNGENGQSQQGWMPLSSKALVLLPLAILTLLIGVIIEVLAQRSQANGGLALSPTQKDIPTYAMVGYLYGPNIVAVLYSTIWSWVDLDAKRMQPWFELSKPSGATAVDSIFLTYPYDFVATVPINAAKKRHWPVFMTGTATVLILWLITPLQSAILGTGVVIRTDIVNITQRSQLLPVEQQQKLIAPELLQTGYSVGWLNQSTPPFTTMDYAMLPFHLGHDTAPTKSGTNYTAVTSKLSVDLDCWPAKIYPRPSAGKQTYDFLDGRGCNFTLPFPLSGEIFMQYISYKSSPYSDYFLESPACPETASSSHQALAVWTEIISTGVYDKDPKYNITAMFCQPRYYSQEVLATVEASRFKPITSAEKALSPREILSADKFNSSAFEFLIINGMDADFYTRDDPYNVGISFPRLRDRGLAVPISTMIGFALAQTNLSVSAYADPKVLQEAFQWAHRYLFSVAVSALLKNETSFANNTATSTYALSGIIVSRPFSAGVEALLLVVSIFTLTLWWTYRNTPCNLSTDASSISSLVDVFRNSSVVASEFITMDSTSDEVLLRKFKDYKFRLVSIQEDGQTHLSIERVWTEPQLVEEQESSAEPGFYKPVRPIALRREIGFLLIIILLGAVAGVSYLKWKADALQGLPRPSQNFEVLQLLENFVPTVFSTLLEPFLVLLNRLLCVLQPFQDMWKGRAKPARSIEADYTSIPPQLAFIRAVKSNHFMLATMCSVALLANVLAVGLGALFNEEPMIASYSQSFRPTVEAKFNNSVATDLGAYLMGMVKQTIQYPDHFYVATSNISGGNALPPWVTKDYFFQPHDLVGNDKREELDTYHLATRGFGINARCKAVPKFVIPSKLDLPPASIQDQNLTVCPDPVHIASSRVRNSNFMRSSGLSAFEYCGIMSSGGGYDLCDKTLTLGWGRTPAAENMNGTIDSTFTVCNPAFETAMFNVTIDSSGNVLSYNQTSAIESTLGYEVFEREFNATAIYFNRQVTDTDAKWQNDSFARNWMDYLVVLTTGSRDIIDPSKPTPTAEQMIPLVNSIYRLTFAIFLGINPFIFESSGPDTRITGTRLTKETRIFLDKPAFIITMTILAIDIVVALIFYARSVFFVLPRMPHTIASLLAYIAPSRMLTRGFATLHQKHHLQTFSFGRYVGIDEKVHVGIELDPYVTPVDPASLREPRKGEEEKEKNKKRGAAAGESFLRFRRNKERQQEGEGEEEEQRQAERENWI